jgi:hypothetical protein
MNDAAKARRDRIKAQADAKRGVGLGTHCRTDGFPLEDDTDGFGRHVTRCRGCERRARGLCLDCPASVTGRALRCVLCGKRRRAEQTAQSAKRNREKRNARAAAYGRRHRKARREYLRKWRDANRLKVAGYDRRRRLQGKQQHKRNPAYHAAYRERNREKLKLQERERRARLKRMRADNFDYHAKAA